MANDHLKTALAHANLTVEQFADIIQVDPKTVQRWVSGRTPYTRHRGTVSRALDIPEHELWPDSVPAPAPVPAPHDEPALPVASAIQGWAHVYDDGAPNPIALLTDIYEQIDLLDAGGELLQEPGVIAALQKLIDGGCKVRIITAGLTPQQTWPTEIRQLRLRTIEQLEIHHIILRLDDTMLLILPLKDDRRPPLFALQRQSAVEVFDRFSADIDRHWNRASPIDPAAPTALPTDPGGSSARVDVSEPPKRGRTSA
jgi:hypothetical protein